MNSRLPLRVVLTAAILWMPGWAAGQTFSYLYSLADFTGTVPYSEVDLYVDRRADEIYATVGNTVRIFNASGMEVFRFDHDPMTGIIHDLAVDERGDILLLTVDPAGGATGPSWFLTRCDYRGVPVERIHVRGLPVDLEGFIPNLMFHREGRFYLASRSRLQVVAADEKGEFRERYDLAERIGVPDGRRGDNDITGFNLDRNGNFLVTIAARFQAFVVSPGGGVRAFGRPGSVPGSFGIVAGIAGDEDGRVFVADKLRNVVLVFNDELEFVTEYGTRTGGRSGLVRPTGLASGEDGRLYVTQARNRGVAVFQFHAPERNERPEAAARARGGEVRDESVGFHEGFAGTEKGTVPVQGVKAPVRPPWGWR